MVRWFNLVESSCADPAREDEFNSWYNNVHIPDVLSCPGFIGATRYEVREPQEGRGKYLAVYENETGRQIAFTDWMAWGVPVVVIMIPLAWLLLTRKVASGPMVQVPHPGPWRRPERRVLVVFGFTALAWVFRANPFGGWTSLFPEASWIGDDTIALLAVAFLFVLPNGEGGRLLDWETANTIPWGLLLLFGGGMAIASAFKESGLSTVLAQGLSRIADGPPVLVIAVICLTVTFLTELTSNTATTALLMPILAAAGLAAGVDPALLMVPAAMSASCAFMLPVATAPNAIIFGTGAVPIRTMVREGLFLNLLGAAVITTVAALSFT